MVYSALCIDQSSDFRMIRRSHAYVISVLSGIFVLLQFIPVTFAAISEDVPPLTQSVFIDSWVSTGDRSVRNAYLTMMYCGTSKDYEFFVASRVMLSTLKRTKPEADLVVITSKSCPEQWKHTYVADGLRVVEVEDLPNPYSSQPKFNRRFLHTLNKLYAWKLEEYNRIVMLDSDNMFLQNTDELFQCGDFCAVFINPCVFHTGLFVLKPSNKTFSDMMMKLTNKIRSSDGADQGFLGSYFSNLIDRPFFRPPPGGGQLTGEFRLPFGYQMDASYYYFRLKWNFACGPNSVITFPSVPLLKPWFWYAWPILPLGLSWHEWRRSTIGYQRELPAAAMQTLTYLLILVISLAIRKRFPPTERAYLIKSLLNRCPCLSDGWHYPLCYPWTIKLCVVATIAMSFLSSFFAVPTTCHPFMGWGLFFLGSLSLQSLLLSILYLPVLPVLVPWLAFLANFVAMGLPIYAHGFQRLGSTILMSSLSAPFLWWALKELVGAIDLLAEREPLMSRLCVRHN